MSELRKTISIKISFTGVIDIKGIEDGSMISIPDTFTVEDVYNKLGIRKEHRKYLISIINGDKKKSSYRFHDNDHLSLFLPVGGG